MIHLINPTGLADRKLSRVRMLQYVLAPLLSGCFICKAASAEINVALDVGDIRGAGWSALGIVVRTGLTTTEEVAISVSIEEIHLPAGGGVLKKVEINCPKAKLEVRSFQCPHGSARLVYPELIDDRFSVAIRYDADGRLSVSFKDIKLTAGTVTGHFERSKPRWMLSATGSGLSLSPFLRHLKTALPKLDLTVSGKASVELQLSGEASTVRRGELRGALSGVQFTDKESTHVGEGVGLTLALDAERSAGTWALTTDISLNKGQVYLEPIFLDVSEKPVRVAASARWVEKLNELHVLDLTYDHSGLVRVTGEAVFDLTQPPRLVKGNTTINNASLPRVYMTYLQPLLIGTVLDDLETAGELSGNLRYELEKVASVNIQIDDLFMDDRGGRFGIYGLNGAINWRAHGTPLVSQLTFAGGDLYKVGIGAGHVALASAGRELRLAAPASIPVLDGELKVTSFEMRSAGTEELSWQFDAGITPVSMEAFTHAVGWPLMAGKLSGMVPDVHYARGDLTVGGALLVRAFDGAVTINNLHLKDLFGVVPQLSADAMITDLDLEALTRTFSFGKIEGKLSGYVRNLRLVNWAPVGFEASFGTPERDRWRRRISQRAIDDLTSLGGGVSGALSTGFLGLFKDFSYDRIGLSCRLTKEVCEMDGVAPAPNGGFYIVTGAGVPRIDVIGYVRRVNWQELVERLKNVSLESGPVVQ